MDRPRTPTSTQDPPAERERAPELGRERAEPRARSHRSSPLPEALAGARDGAIAAGRAAARGIVATLHEAENTHAHAAQQRARALPANRRNASVADVDRELAKLTASAPTHPRTLPRVVADPTEVGLPDLVLGARHEGSRAVRIWLLQFLLTVLVVLVPLALFNRSVDPFGVWGKSDSATSLNGDRAIKMHLFENQPLPRFIMLGASRVQKYNPAVITKIDGKTGFNASIAGSNIIDQMAFASYAAERAGHGKAMPHVIYGIAPEEFRGQPTGADMLKYPELERQLTGQSRVAQSLKSKWEPLVQWGTVRESWAALLHGGEGGDQGAATGGFTQTFAKNGFLQLGYGDHTLRSPRSTQAQQAKTVSEYTAVYASKTVGDTIPGDAAADFERILQIANAHGDQPTIFLVPMQPSLAAKLGPLGRTKQIALIRAYFTQLQKTYRFRWFDYSDVRSFGGSSATWYDGAHPMAPVGTAVMTKLVKDSRASGSKAL